MVQIPKKVSGGASIVAGGGGTPLAPVSTPNEGTGLGNLTGLLTDVLEQQRVEAVNNNVTESTFGFQDELRSHMEELRAEQGKSTDGNIQRLKDIILPIQNKYINNAVSDEAKTEINFVINQISNKYFDTLAIVRAKGLELETSQNIARQQESANKEIQASPTKGTFDTQVGIFTSQAAKRIANNADEQTTTIELTQAINKLKVTQILQVIEFSPTLALSMLNMEETELLLDSKQMRILKKKASDRKESNETDERTAVTRAETEKKKADAERDAAIKLDLALRLEDEDKTNNPTYTEIVSLASTYKGLFTGNQVSEWKAKIIKNAEGGTFPTNRIVEADIATRINLDPENITVKEIEDERLNGLSNLDTDKYVDRLIKKQEDLKKPSRKSVEEKEVIILLQEDMDNWFLDRGIDDEEDITFEDRIERANWYVDKSNSLEDAVKKGDLQPLEIYRQITKSDREERIKGWLNNWLFTPGSPSLLNRIRGKEQSQIPADAILIRGAKHKDTGKPIYQLPDGTYVSY